MGNAVTVDLGGFGAQLDAHVGDQVGQGIRLKDNGKGQVLGSSDLVGIRLDKLAFIELEAVLVAVQLAGTLASAAVAVRKVVEHQADDLLLASPPLHRPGRCDGGVDVGEVGNLGHPNEAADLLNLVRLDGIGEITLPQERPQGLIQFRRPFGVHKLCLADERVHIIGPWLVVVRGG